MSTQKTPPISRRSQAERRAGSEQSLLKAAISVIAEEGMGAVTFDAVSRKSGLSRGLVTQRFGSKQGLIEAALARLLDDQAKMLTEQRVDTLPGLDAVLAFVDFTLRGLGAGDGGRAYAMLLSSAIADASEMRARFAQVHAGIERQLEGWILRGQREGAIRADLNADAAGLMVGSLLLGLCTQLLVDPKTKLDPIRETILGALRLSLAVPAGTAAQPGRR